jgi:hypothetical protein
VVRKQPPPPISFLPEPLSRRRSPVVGRPPPSALCLGRRPFHPCKRMRDFVAGSAIPANSGGCAAAHRRAPPPPAWAPPPRRVRSWLAVGSAADGPDSIDPRVKPASNGQPGLFVKETPGFFLIACRSFHLERPLKFSPKFYVLASVLLEFHT